MNHLGFFGGCRCPFKGVVVQNKRSESCILVFVRKKASTFTRRHATFDDARSNHRPLHSTAEQNRRRQKRHRWPARLVCSVLGGASRAGHRTATRRERQGAGSQNIRRLFP
ncbi:unnamed protein product [Ixodes pacificus]